jgi:hypothetical protein
MTTQLDGAVRPAPVEVAPAVAVPAFVAIHTVAQNYEWGRAAGESEVSLP